MFVQCFLDLRKMCVFYASMGSRKVATTIYITVEQDRQLKLLSQSTEKAMAAYIREGIDLILEKYQANVPRQLGLSIDE